MSITANLSIIIITRPDAPTLAQAKKSAQFANEVLVIKKESISDFAFVRNQALKKAKYEWVLFLDSDEIITAESVSEIRRIIVENKLDGVYINRQDVFYDKPLKFGEAGSTVLLRMGKKTKMKWQRPVHEIANIRGEVGKSNIKILHYAHSSLQAFCNSITNYAQLETNFRNQSNQSFYLCQLLFYPWGKFIYNYVIKLGFLDGWRGLSYAVMMSLHSLAVRVLQYELKHEKS
ncbi:glycosyltransferase family 2 protein [Patescibacteria group bacterium]|nr:glycosyltransferase family 2 protein [Patescibacteria group bacterium]MBU1967498.1 glycosyltransferase family 2 protein [Patescibacteria group bacterium]MBU2543488.1 glycosyltransferase family 2 protein [Patescibacteria group bacterium]